MSANANYATVPKSGSARLTTANTARDGTGTLGTTLMNVFTAGASGSRIDDIVINALATTTAGMIRLYLFDGTNHRLYAEYSVSATTPSATVQAWRQPLTGMALILPSGYSLRASTNNAELFDITVTRGGDF